MRLTPLHQNRDGELGAPQPCCGTLRRMELGISAAVTAAMCLILGVVLREAVEGMLSSLHRRLSRSTANAPKSGEQVQCSLRAVSGPVHGIGSQWIDGSGTFTHQSMRFEPTGSAEGTTTQCSQSIVQHQTGHVG